MTPDFIRETLDALGKRDADIAKAIGLVGYPEPRNREPGFGALLNIVAAQQVSSASAAAIRTRLLAAIDPLTPENFLAASDETLRAVGFSRRKVEYGRGIAEAMRCGLLDAERLAAATDDEVVAKYRGNATLALPDSAVEALERAILELEAQDDLTGALAPLAMQQVTAR